MNESKERKKGAILSYVSIIVTTIIQLIYAPFLIRKLGQSEYGLYSLVQSIIGYLTVLDLGFGNAIIVYTAKYRSQKKYDEEKKLHGMFFLIFCIIGIVASVIGLVLYFNVNNLFEKTMTFEELRKAKIMMLILTFNLAITFPFSIYSSIISAYEKFTYQKLLSIASTILKPLIMIPLLLFGYRAITMSIVITIVNIIVLLSNYLYCKNKLDIKIKFQGFDKVLFKTIFSYSFFIFLSVIVDKVNWSVDQFVLGAVSGTIAVSVYSVASQINTLFINLSTAISGVLLPKMSKMVSENATSEELTNEFIKVGRIQWLIIFLAVSGLVLFGKEFIIWWAGDDYLMSYYVAIILTIPISLPLIQNLGISIMQAKNKFKFKAIATSVMAVVNVIISIFLAKKYGPVGSATGTAISLIVCNVVIINIYYYKVINLNVIKFWKSILKMTIPFIIPVVIILSIKYITALTGITSIIVYGSIYTLIYVIIAYKLSINKYEKDLINGFMKKLKLR